MSWLSKRTANDRHFVMKFVLRTVCLLFTLASLIAAAASIRGWDVSFFVAFYGPAWVVSVVWNLLWILIMLGRQMQIAPGIIVAFDLLIWLYYLVPAVLGWFSYVAVTGPWRSYYDDDYYDSSDRSAMGAGIAAAGVFAFLAICLHFWLFVLGCIDEDRRRRNIRAQLQSYAANAAAYGHHNHAAPAQYAQCTGCNGLINLQCAHCVAARDGKPVNAPTYSVPTYSTSNGAPQQGTPVSVPARSSVEPNEKSGN